MNKRKKAERGVAGLLNLLGDLGVDTTELKEQPIVNEHDFRKSLEAEGILLSLMSDKRTVAIKRCKQCIDPFGTNYQYVAYCSNACRATALKKLGIKWDPTKKDQQRWGSIDNPSQLPIIINKHALEQLRRIVDTMQAIQTQNEMAEFVEHQSQTQNESLLQSEVLTRAKTAINQAAKPYQWGTDQQYPHFDIIQAATVSHKVEEQEPTNSDPEPLVSKQPQSPVQFDLSLFE